jgi:hypothetical protein
MKKIKTSLARVWFVESVLSLILLLPIDFSFAYSWQAGELISPHGMPNPYEIPETQFHKVQRFGLRHALHWPVDVTGILVPYSSTRAILPIVENRLNLIKYPRAEGEGVFYVPFPDGGRPNRKMGITIMDREGTKGYTFSCASCHSGTLFGRPIIGMTKRFPGANELFITAKHWISKIDPDQYQKITLADDQDKIMYQRAYERIQYIEAKAPATKGLDTSLAHVALALSYRAKDEYATMDPEQKKNPREEKLRTFVADSKPAVWWNVKYKNKWLLDGSVESGNPILTNLIWNEIGRGVDLAELEEWLIDNKKIVEELTTAVYATESPRITDFFSADKINLDSAKWGQKLFQNKCSKCHGDYHKNWDREDSVQLSLSEKIKTFQVKYFSNTPVVDVGTDPQRYQGMASLLQLNDLKISKFNNVVIKQQKGYVPPPLVGIWARFPYLHNNSVPSLCELLKPAKDRVKSYIAGEVQKENHFDFSCNGYPLGKKVPALWKLSGQGHAFNTESPGLTNQGHDFGFEKLTDLERQSLIQFLQTL